MPNSSDFNRFAVNPVNIDISRSLFNMDHSVKWSCNVGEVIPFDCIEVLPGDTFTIDTSKVIRLQPLVTPIMDEIIMDTYWFFVPNRLVWNHWKNFMGENTESAWAPEVEYSIPQIYAPNGGFQIGTIADYMGIPIQNVSSEDVDEFHFSALPFRAYALICSEWFRSEALQDPVHVFMDDTTRQGSNGNNQVSDIELGGKPFIACKFFDYFTGALPAPQRGEAVSLKLTESTSDRYVPVVTHNNSVAHPYHSGNTADANISNLHMTYLNSQTNKFAELSSGYTYPVSASNNGVKLMNSTTTAGALNPFFDNLYADIGAITSVSVNQLRTAFAMQKYLEKSARYGGRYTEFIKGFFNVDSPDARLQRTEYLGGNRLSLNINQVEQTSATEQDLTPLGNVAGMSVTADSNSDFTKSFTEHGFVIGCAVARYHHSYQNGFNKMWLRKTNLDFYNPVFANLGEQAIKVPEIFVTGAGTDNPMVFGYQERWAEYRYQPNRVAGEMRSNAQTSLDMWHLADNYSVVPFLSANWIREDKTNLDRCLAVTSDVSNQIICDFYIKTEASRPMPLYSIPGLIDHH